MRVSLKDFMRLLIDVDSEIDYVIIDIREEFIGTLFFDEYHKCIVNSIVDVDTNRADIIEICFYPSQKMVTIMIDAVLLHE